VSSSEGGTRHPGRIGVGDTPGIPCRVVGFDFTPDSDGPLVAGYRDADGALHIDSVGDASPRVQVAYWAQAMAPAFREFHEQMRHTLEAIGVSLRPLVEFIEQHPELRDMQPEPPTEGCHHFCGRWPEHDCDGEATGTLAYRPGGREVPVCGGCRDATLARSPRPPARDAAALDPELEAAKHWTEHGGACAHVCGGGADHRCGAKATTSLTYRLPSGGTRRMPICGPCKTAEEAALQDTHA